MENATELVRSLMNKYNVKFENIIRHYDVTHKVCPKPFVDDAKYWNKFKEGIKMQDITDPGEALEYLIEKGRITSGEYWKNALSIVKNLDSLLVKWANDVKKIEE